MLDEATSALDSETEQKIQQALNVLSASRTAPPMGLESSPGRQDPLSGTKTTSKGWLFRSAFLRVILFGIVFKGN